ncbi:MAG: sugar phosphate isomerase/epimerase family protein, partial [Planctomycetota bacterium]
MLQLKKSVRLDCLRQPFKKALVTAATLGADAIEINAATEIRPAELSRTGVRHLRKMLADLNLKVSAVNLPTRLGYDVVEGLDRRLDDTRAAMSMAYSLGTNVVVNRIGRIPADVLDPHWVTMVQALTDLGMFSQKSGAFLAARVGMEPVEHVEKLIESLPKHAIAIDFDPCEFLINGHSPNDAIQSLGASVMNFRARDAVADLSIGKTIEVELGRGSIDWPTLLGTLEEHNYRGFIAVERHGTD